MSGDTFGGARGWPPIGSTVHPSICAVDPVQVMQLYVEITGDYDGVETVEGKTRGKCWDGGLPSAFHMMFRLFLMITEL